MPQPHSNYAKRIADQRRLWLLALIILVALALRLYHIQTQSIWFDEGWSAYAADQPTLVAAANADATNPPLYYVLLNGFARGLGDSAFALRLFSTFAGLLVIPLTDQLARRAFGSRAGLFAAAGVAVSPLLWWASQEARMYTLLALLIVVAALALGQLLEQPKRWAWIALWLAELGLLYAHNTGPVAVIWLNLIVAAAWIAHRSLRCPGWRVWVGGQVGVALLWSPYFVSRYLALGAANSAVGSAPYPDLKLLEQIWEAFWAGNWAMVNAERSIEVLSALAFVIALAVIQWRRAAARLMVAHVVLLTAGVVAGLIVLGNELHGRYLVMVAPLLIVPMAAGVARLRWPILRAALSAFFALAFAVAFIMAQNPIYQHDDARGMARYYADHLTAADSVLAWSYADRYDLAYYWPREGVTARRVTLPEGADLDQIAPLLPRSGDVALNVWYTQRADYRGMLGCVLGQGTVNVPDQFTTYGMTTLVYHQPTLDLPQMQPFDATYAVAHVDSVASIPSTTADRALCLPIQITLTSPAPGELKAALIVHNPLGWEIARSDAIFAQADERTSGQLAPGDRLTAYPLLRLPVGAPPGDYPLYLRLYEPSAAPDGYEVVSASTSVSARDVQIGTWRIAPGADWSKVNRMTDLPERVDQPVAGLTLVALSQGLADALPVGEGDTARLTLLWRGPGALPDLRLHSGQIDYATIPALTGAHDDLTLDWRDVRIPRGTERALALDADGTTVAHYDVTTLPLVLSPPAFDQPVGVALHGVGTLVGYSVTSPTAERSRPLPVTLVWQAAAAADSTSYTVFVQLLDAQGQLIAQSDSLPANGDRPTSGWRSGEYIVDAHALTFNDRAHPGPATLIAGLYDASTGQRVHLADGSDAIPLPGTITVR